MHVNLFCSAVQYKHSEHIMCCHSFSELPLPTIIFLNSLFGTPTVCSNDGGEAVPPSEPQKASVSSPLSEHSRGCIAGWTANPFAGTRWTWKGKGRKCHCRGIPCADHHRTTCLLLFLTTRSFSWQLVFSLTSCLSFELLVFSVSLFLN